MLAASLIGKIYAVVTPAMAARRDRDRRHLQVTPPAGDWA
jgi:hypothetical protein